MLIFHASASHGIALRISPQQADVSCAPTFPKRLLLLPDSGLGKPWGKWLFSFSVGNMRQMSGARSGRVASARWHVEFIFTASEFPALAL